MLQRLVGSRYVVARLGSPLLLSQQASTTTSQAPSPTEENGVSSVEPTGLQYSSSDWREHLNLSVSYKPSVLSPLHPVYQQTQQLNLKFRYLELALKAEEKLGPYLEQRLESGVVLQLQQRAQRYNRLATLLTQLQQREPVQLSSRLDRIYGFYEALRREVHTQDSVHEEFSGVQSGELDPWEYWLREFEHKYSKVPSLEPLEVLYNKPDPEAEINELRQKALQAAKRATLRRPRHDFWAASDMQDLLQQPQTQEDKTLGPSSTVDVLGNEQPMSKGSQPLKHSIGRRKTARATVALWPGTGCITVNGKPYDDYFSDYFHRFQVLRPLFVSGLVGQYNCAASLRGGGISGQSQALRLAIAKALHRAHAVTGPVLAQHQLLKRDARTVERKKPGQKKARKKFAWVKR